MTVKNTFLKSRRTFFCHMFCLCSISLNAGRCRVKRQGVVPGIEVLLAKKQNLIRGKKIGLITNQTGVDRGLNNNIDLLKSTLGTQLVALFSPEHGIQGWEQAGGKVNNQIKNSRKIPIFSLYGENLLPTSEMLSDVDLLVYDIQDVGSRYYTYLSTLKNCLNAANQKGIPFIVLDRPNPLGGLKSEGKILKPKLYSFVGPSNIPARYGLTPGELALWMKAEINLKSSLTVVRMEQWKRKYWYDDTNLEWIPPSPNIPTSKIALLYSGTCLIEGTNLSEGRGTTTPFEVVGAPWIDGRKLAKSMGEYRLPGVAFRETTFIPTFSKYSKEKCYGVQLHVTNREKFRPLQTVLCLIHHIHSEYSCDFKWSNSHFDRLAGSEEIRKDIQNGQSVEIIVEKWQQELEQFRREREEFLLYP